MRLFESQGQTDPPVLGAIETLRAMNADGKRALPEDAPSDFLPKKLRPFVFGNGSADRHAWECALLLTIRDELKGGNVAVCESKRFGHFDQFFIADATWHTARRRFFEKAGLPVNAEDVSS